MLLFLNLRKNTKLWKKTKKMVRFELLASQGVLNNKKYVSKRLKILDYLSKANRPVFNSELAKH